MATPPAQKSRAGPEQVKVARPVAGAIMWRRFESLALLATIPAFYLSIIGHHRALATLMYLLAFSVSAWVSVKEAIAAGKRLVNRTRVGSYLSLPLGAALLLSAAMAQGDASDLVTLRLGTAVLVILRWAESMLPTAWRSALPQLLGLGIGVLGLCGLGFWWLEPRATTYGDGLWLAFTTAATVGYGDIVPSTPASKIFAVFVVLTGFAVLSLVTASIAALWVQTEERRIEREILRDVHRELSSLRRELAIARLAHPHSETSAD